ncbi:hypothetical protein TRFO_22897 [Tritrichomonas foetus]|uniref:Uncharacterized protein n=1 Tax=Tritrichomonas foetus TaxID=1144522 RepID=A0A1J4KC55_9EUKA|nr:hypothetical protein TRFO_22897 [Tritrichomonas foetus]|eukprot:OHT08554.1 hypothetical protein TRFO_22897 [Tritrichomonas foetus]
MSNPNPEQPQVSAAPEDPNIAQQPQNSFTASQQPESLDVPIGADPDLNKVIQMLLESSGFEIHDPNLINLVEKALCQKIDIICANARSFAGVQETGEPRELHLSQLKPALNEERISIDRPEFVLEQPNSKMTTRRTKIGK